MSLRRILADMMTLRPQRYRTLLDALSLRLKTTAEEGILRPGDPMPDFVLPDAQGNLVFSDDLLAKGPLVVVFFRGDWCPFCKTTLTALNEIVPDIEAAGGSLVAMTPDTGEYLNAVWRGLGLRFPVLSDVDGAIGMRFGTVYRVPDELFQFWQGVGIDLTARHGDASRLLPMPATFIADDAGILRYCHASGDITNRAEPDDIVSFVRGLRRLSPTGRR